VGLIGLLRAVAVEISKYKLDLVGVQEVRWNNYGKKPASEHTYFYGKGNENHELGTTNKLRGLSPQANYID
jgi:hypothetical protein